MDIKTSTSSSSPPLDLKQELLARKRGIEGANPLTDSFNLLVLRTVVDCCATATAMYESELADFESFKAQIDPLPRRKRFLALLRRDLAGQTPSDPQGYCKADNIVPFFAQGEGGAVFASLDLLAEKGLVKKDTALILLRVRPTELGARLVTMEEQPALLPPSGAAD